MDDINQTKLNNIYLITGIILAILLMISELLGWSKCDAKAITQLYRCLHCQPPAPDQSPEAIVDVTNYSRR